MHTDSPKQVGKSRNRDDIHLPNLGAHSLWTPTYPQQLMYHDSVPFAAGVGHIPSTNLQDSIMHLHAVIADPEHLD
jgi:hypothetical protein